MKYLLRVFVASLLAILCSCARHHVNEDVYTPLHASDFLFPPGVAGVIVGTRDGNTTQYVFNEDSLLTDVVTRDIAEQVVRSYHLTYKGKRLRQVEDNNGERFDAVYEDSDEYSDSTSADFAVPVRLIEIKGKHRLRRYCYNSERGLQVDTVKTYDIVDGTIRKEPIHRVDFAYARSDRHLTGKWERNFESNTVDFTAYAADGFTPNQRLHYKNGVIQGKKSGNKVYHSGAYTDSVTGAVYYTTLTERVGTSRKGSIADTWTRAFIARGEDFPQSISTVTMPASVASVLDSPETMGVAIAFIVIFVGLTWLLIRFANRRRGVLRHFGGPWVPYGMMRRMWMFNWQPYVKMLAITGIIFVSFTFTVALFQLIGYGIAGLIWLARTAAIVILFPAGLMVSGWMVAALLYLFSETVRGWVHKYLLLLLKLSPLIVLAGLLMVYEDEVREYGDTAAQWCTTVLSGMTLQGIVSNWRIVLAVLTLPVVAFLAIAASTMLFTGLLCALEWIVMKIYRVHVRCPHCNSDRFDYIVHGRRYPVGLHPGLYGVFTHSFEGIKVPTMLLNGKGRLTRRCSACGHDTTLSNDRNVVGTDVHIGVAGNPATGKSWLIYEGLYQLIASHNNTMREHNKGKGLTIDTAHRMIEEGRDFQTNAERYTRAVQVMIDRKNQPMPWHTHWWDVAGENFDSSSSPTELSFYRQVRCIALLIDPMLTVPGHGASDRYRSWMERQRGYRPRYDINDTVSHLQRIIEQSGGSTDNIHVVVVLAKADLGYLQGVAGIGDYANANSPAIARFIEDDMGLSNVMLYLKNRYRSVECAAVSVTAPRKASLKRLFAVLLSRVGIKVD